MSAAKIIEHRGHTVELTRRLESPRNAISSGEAGGWYAAVANLGTELLGKFQTSDAAEQACCLWIDQKIREGRL